MCEVKRTAESLDASDQLRQRVSALEAERDTLAAEKADCEKFLKEGERLDECLERWRADALAVLKLLTQEKKKSEALAAEVAKLLAACAAKDEAICTLRDHITVGMYRAVPHLADVAAEGLSTDAGKGWVDSSGAVESMALPVLEDGNAWIDGTPLPAAWVGKSVLILVKP